MEVTFTDVKRNKRLEISGGLHLFSGRQKSLKHSTTTEAETTTEVISVSALSARLTPFVMNLITFKILQVFFPPSSQFAQNSTNIKNSRLLSVRKIQIYLQFI